MNERQNDILNELLLISTEEAVQQLRNGNDAWFTRVLTAYLHKLIDKKRSLYVSLHLADTIVTVGGREMNAAVAERAGYLGQVVPAVIEVENLRSIVSERGGLSHRLALDEIEQLDANATRLAALLTEWQEIKP